MKVVLATLLIVTLSYEVSAFSLGSRATYTCPALMQFYEEVMQCAEKMEAFSTISDLCKEFTAGSCRGLTQIYANDCGKNYGGDPVYSQLRSTMRDVKQMCF